VFGVGRLFEWWRDLVAVHPPPATPPATPEATPYPLAPVVEALARQRALAEQRLRRAALRGEERGLEQGRRMAIIEVSKELGIHDDVTSRTHELRRRS
jgi:hypothetical protein